MIPFAGFDMPVQYTGIRDEHLAVRRAAGLFDVSHMGEVRVTGEAAFPFVQRLVTNDISKLYDGRVQYTVMCLDDGGIVDDLLVYRLSSSEFMLVINASNVEKDVAWMREQNPMGASIEDVSGRTALLALQGPASTAILAKLTDLPLGDMASYHAVRMAPGAFLGCEEAILSTTGYTGEIGYEIYCEPERANLVWDRIMDAGQSLGVQPAGLGARDTLRLEAGYCLYGNDISESTSPLEAGLGWVTKLTKDDFIGKSALVAQKDVGLPRRLVGFVLEARGIPRHGYSIEDGDGNPIGVVTSGTQSPVLEQGIGLGYVPNESRFTEPGSQLHIRIRDHAVPARVKKAPLHK